MITQRKLGLLFDVRRLPHVSFQLRNRRFTQSPVLHPYPTRSLPGQRWMLKRRSWLRGTRPSSHPTELQALLQWVLPSAASPSIWLENCCVSHKTSNTKHLDCRTSMQHMPHLLAFSFRSIGLAASQDSKILRNTTCGCN